jgi:hypothetical protein
MYLDIYAEMVKLVFDRGLTLEPPRNPDGTVRRQLFLLLDDNYFSLSTTITS